MFHSNEIVLQNSLDPSSAARPDTSRDAADSTLKDLPDIEQELSLRLIQKLAQFDHTRAHVHAFIRVVSEQAAGMMIRERLAKKRDTTGIRSLDTPEDDGTTEPVDYRDGGGEPGRIDLANDMAAAMASLPVELRTVAERLKLQTVSEAAREMNVPRTTFLRWVERLRQCFEDAGLQIYL